MTDFNGLGGYSLLGVDGVCVIVGKNGCGKSTVLKQFEQNLQGREGYGVVRYISPERAGVLSYEPNVERNMLSRPTWLPEARRQNQSDTFKQQSATLFRRLELLTLREIERDHTLDGYIPQTFQATIDKIDSLLERVRMERAQDGGFRIMVRETGALANPAEISSGESELISLAIEFLSFSKEADPSKQNILVVDEPDVHLHPDLQDRLARFIVEELAQPHIIFVLATHSTALLSALANEAPAKVAFMKRGEIELTFRPITEVLERVLPMFGAHPLSNVFSKSPILIVEGEDDERIWQQAVRSSNGRLRLHPCVADSIDRIAAFEAEADAVLGAVYDNAIGYSLRDRDDAAADIDDVGRIRRMRLSCRAAENLMLCDDVLELAGTSWNTLQARILTFVAENRSHPYYAHVANFAETLDRKETNIKSIRNVLIGMVSTKPWEVLVGQSIARLAQGHDLGGEHSLRAYLGEKVCTGLLALPAKAVEAGIAQR